jgi:hypothetical protein
LQDRVWIIVPPSSEDLLDEAPPQWAEDSS